jgi:S-formylglutathione hydrolase FrmB
VIRDVRAFAVAFIMVLGISLLAQANGPTQRLSHGTVERLHIHARSLENNLLGDSPDRYVSVYLPPSYLASSTRRYPVVYLLHGFDDDDDHCLGVRCADDA